MRQIARPMPPKPDETASLAIKIFWLVETYGFDALANKVVKLYEPSSYCSMTLDAFRTLYMSWYEDVPRERGKPVRAYATAAWMLHPRRINVAGIRMRPDKGFPCYLGDDGVEVYKNIYRQPVHIDDGTGDAQPFLDFLERFMPAVIEREWLLDWMAYKWLHPEIPGTSPWFVADGVFGVGRGMLSRVLAKLYGEAYCKIEDFDILAGTSAQSVYTDWQANCIMVMVDEAHTSPTAYRRGEKRSVYTALKNCIDPAPKRRTFKVKGQPAFDGMSYCSVTVATNHINATAIPANDRRITVLRNGAPMTTAEAIALDEWMSKPANIAALASYLESSDLSNFNMFQPLRTEAKDEMVDLSLNDVENALLDFAADDDRGLVFPKLFLEREMEAHMTGDGERTSRDNAWRGQLAGAFDEHCIKVKLPHGRDRARVLVGKRRYTLYCFRSRVKQAQALNETERRAHAAKWGNIDSIQTVLRAVKSGPGGGEES